MLPYLSLAIWVPILAGLAVLVVHRDDDASRARWIALAGALAGFLVTLPLYFHFDVASGALQFVERGEWIPRFDVWYHLGVDGISVLFILLNSFITAGRQRHDGRLEEGLQGRRQDQMTHPRSAGGAPPQGGAASGPAEPDPRRLLDGASK